MISIICATNNEEILNDNLFKSLKYQNYKDYELIIVDTKKNKYKGATEALNEGALKATGEYLMFCHHDINFIGEDSLKQIVYWVENIKEFGIIGVAGIKERNSLIGNITNGLKKNNIGIKIEEPKEVFTLDEVVFVIKREFYDKNKLNLDNNTWHLYAVEYCLEVRKKNHKVIVIPANIYHKSDGVSLDKSYFIYLKTLVKKYKNYKQIYTTVGSWYTNRILFNLQMLKRKLEVKK